MPTKKGAPALTILSTGEDRAAWLDARRGIYSATQVSAIAGTNPYYSIVDVWNEHTDPDWSEDLARNRWLDMRAKLGQAREAEIIEWANADPRTGGGLVPNSALVTRAEIPQTHASTPDGIKEGARDGGRVLIECKTTSQDWEVAGIPDHIWDQVQWQLYTTGAVSCWLAVEVYTWSKGKTPVATLVKTWLVPIFPDPKRLAYLLGKLDEFVANETAGIAPESEVDLTAVPEIEWDDDDESAKAKLAAQQAAEAIDAMLTEVAEIDERTKADLARRKELDAAIKVEIKAYHGRRIDLIGTRYIGRLIRGTRKKFDDSWISEAERRAHTDWTPSETVSLMPNPSYITPDTTTESE